MQQLIRRRVGRLVATIEHSTRADGDLSPSQVLPVELEQRRQAAVPHAWRAVHQVHSDRVIKALGPTDGAERPFADALVTDQPGLALAVHSGDCVPVGFVHPDGAVGAAHAGWKGLEAGVLESTVRRLKDLGSTNGAELEAVVGPHIRSDRYEFGERDLARLAARFGDKVISTTNSGTPALDLTAAIASELDRLGVTVAAWSHDCTARDEDRYWSHRARGEAGRIALVAWLEESP